MVNCEEDEQFLSVKNFADLVNLHQNTIRRSIKDGRLSAFKIGSGKRAKYRIPRSEINRISMIDLEKIVEKMVQDKLDSSLKIDKTTAMKE